MSDVLNARGSKLLGKEAYIISAGRAHVVRVPPPPPPGLNTLETTGPLFVAQQTHAPASFPSRSVCYLYDVYRCPRTRRRTGYLYVRAYYTIFFSLLFPYVFILLSFSVLVRSVYLPGRRACTIRPPRPNVVYAANVV